MSRAIGRLLTVKQREAFIAAAFGYLGVRFRHQGRSLRGVDCAGLVAVGLAAIGRHYDDVPAYSREPQHQGLREAMIANLGEPVSEMQAGDVAMMAFNGGPPSHVGIVTDHPDYKFGLLHAYAINKKVVFHGIDAEWMGRIVEVYRP